MRRDRGGALLGVWVYWEVYFDLNIRHFHENRGEPLGIPTELHIGAESAAMSWPLVMKR